MVETLFKNPFRPGAGHMPPYLAGRKSESEDFRKLLSQTTILQNLVLTGLRGVGKTVLLETFKPMAIAEGWLWAGTDLSESMSITEDNLAIRLLTDLAVVTTSIAIHEPQPATFFRQQVPPTQHPLNYQALLGIYEAAPGLAADKLKAVLELVWTNVSQLNKRGIIFAYDEAQNLSDHAAKEQFPLSLLLDVFQSLQRKNIPFMLALTGLPTLFPKLVEARTYAERMFHVISLGPLTSEETQQAVKVPLKASKCPFPLSDESITVIWTITKGYPYFVQYVCKEVYDVWVQNANSGESLKPIPTDAITRKLDTDFFYGRWARATDRQRALMRVVADLENSNDEFTVQDIVERSKIITPERPFSASLANQMLSALGGHGLVYKNRHGKYLFAVPLMDQFIKRQTDLTRPEA